MANTEYLLPDGGFFDDTEQDAEELLPAGGYINEQTPAAGGVTMLDFERATMRGANRGVMRGV